ncbi:MAG: hypothetical protein K6U74_01080 [Firmicutes bacterium]|nr:hypothetical protein [Bacillota bacterium]
MKPLKPKKPEVIVPDHAWDCWLARANRPPNKRNALAKLVSTLLYNQMAAGTEVYSLETEIDLGGIYAVLVLGETSWVVKTFLDEGMFRYYRREA